MTSAPWDFGEARDAARQASQAQRNAENFLKDAFRQHAEAEERYRVNLALKITAVRDDGKPATLAADLARGDKEVARMRKERDIAGGVVEAAKQLAWRCAADRRSTEMFCSWSMRRELAEAGGAGVLA